MVAIGAALIVALGAWLTILNPETVRVQLTPSQAIERSVAQVLIAAFALGAGVVTLLTSTRAISRAWRNWQLRRRHARLARHAAATAHARSLVWAGAYDQARAEIGVVRAKQPTDPERVELAAESYLAEDDPAAARTVLERSLTQFGPQPRLLDLLSQAAERSGDLPTAIRTLEQLRPSLRATPRLARRLRDLYITAERFDDALAVQSDLLMGLRRSPSLPAEEQVLSGLRYMLASRDTDPRRAARRLSALARQAPDFTPAAVAAGDRWLSVGRPFFARRTWERSVMHTPAQPLLDRLETLYTDTKRPERAHALYKRLRAAHPAHPLVLLRAARFALVTGALDDAAATLNAVPPAIAATPAAELLTAVLYYRRELPEPGWKLVETATEQLALTMPHTCSACQVTSPAWVDTCPQCHRWGTVQCASVERDAGPVGMRAV